MSDCDLHIFDLVFYVSFTFVFSQIFDFFVSHGILDLYVSVMTSAHVKMLDDYSKEANGPNFTMKRHQDHQRESFEHMDVLRKVTGFHWSLQICGLVPSSHSSVVSTGLSQSFIGSSCLARLFFKGKKMKVL